VCMAIYSDFWRKDQGRHFVESANSANCNAAYIQVHNLFAVTFTRKMRDILVVLIVALNPKQPLVFQEISVHCPLPR